MFSQSSFKTDTKWNNWAWLTNKMLGYKHNHISKRRISFGTTHWWLDLAEFSWFIILAKSFLICPCQFTAEANENIFGKYKEPTNCSQVKRSVASVTRNAPINWILTIWDFQSFLVIIMNLSRILSIIEKLPQQFYIWSQKLNSNLYDINRKLENFCARLCISCLIWSPIVSKITSAKPIYQKAVIILLSLLTNISCYGTISIWLVNDWTARFWLDRQRIYSYNSKLVIIQVKISHTFCYLRLFCQLYQANYNFFCKIGCLFECYRLCLIHYIIMHMHTSVYGSVQIASIKLKVPASIIL